MELRTILGSNEWILGGGEGGCSGSERLCENVDENGGCNAEIRVCGQRVSGVGCQWVSVVEQVLGYASKWGIVVFQQSSWLCRICESCCALKNPGKFGISCCAADLHLARRDG